MNYISFKKIFACFVLALVFSAGNVMAQKDKEKNNKDFKLSKNLDIYFSALRELQTMYVDTLDMDALTQWGIDGITGKLDPYTEFVPAKDVTDFDFMTTGRYAGIGSLIQKDSSWVRIVEPYKGFAAQKAGLVAGDRLLEIDGKSLKGMSIDAVSNMLKGKPNTSLALKVAKLIGNDTVNLSVKRQSIHISGIVYSGMLDNGVGYIRLTSFTEDCSKDFRSAFVDLQKTGQLKSLIIDLRGNGGGLLDEAVKIVNLFVPKGVEIVSARGRDKASTFTYTTTEHPLDINIPLAVLVNSSSASASEIVSGAIQDLDRGVIIGTRTFGKGLVQTVRPTGYNTKIKITTAKYYIPSGRCVQAHNYSQRNEDGSVAFIPDSLKHEFATKAGRKVYDGGGITPDIKTETEEYSRIATSLLQYNLIFEYSLEYYKTHESVATPDKFSITDADYQNFINFLSNKTYDYQTTSELLLKQLTDAVKAEKYDGETKVEIDALSEKLKHDKLKDLQAFKPEIAQLLNEEIVSRYYFREGRVRTMLRDDRQVSMAIKTLQMNKEYTDILTNMPKATAQ